MRLLADYIETTLKELRRYRGKLPPPEEADMPAIKEPDNTDDAKDDWRPCPDGRGDKVAATLNYGSRRDRCEFVQGRAHSKIVTVNRSS